MVTKAEINRLKVEVDRQREQLDRYLAWVREEGGVEGPIRLATYLKPHQQGRLLWLTHNVLGTVLEVGCNWGCILGYVGGHYGVDINPKNIALARILAPDKTFIVGDARSLPLPDRAVDTVMLPEILEHLRWEEVPTAISEALRVATRRVIVSLPNGDEDTEDATNLKHAWLATPDRVQEIAEWLGKGTQTIRKGAFIFLRRDLDALTTGSGQGYE